MRTVDQPSSTSETGPAPRAVPRGGWRCFLVNALTTPPLVTLIALAVYLARASISLTGLGRTDFAFFNYLADAFLHGQLSLRLLPPSLHDLIVYNGQVYLYWPPFPAVLVAPLVALFGVEVSDVLYTAVLGAVSVGLVAALLRALDRSGLARLDRDRRAILVATIAFGSVLLILAPSGRVWFTAQIIGWGCLLLASLAALTQPGMRGYALTGLALACATATRLPLLLGGLWLAYYLLWRDWRRPLQWRLAAAAAGLTPVLVAVALLAWYNVARFGSPFEMGLAWHNMDPFFQADFAQYGAFNLHYLPANLYYQFLAHPLLPGHDWRMGGGLFWMTPVLLGAVYAVWRDRRNRLVWALVLTCGLLYIPIGLLMGTGWITFGPRYLLDLMAPLLVLTARGIARWPVRLLLVLLAVSVATYVVGSALWLTTG